MTPLSLLPAGFEACSSQAPTPTAYIEPSLPTLPAPGARAYRVQAAFRRSARLAFPSAPLLDCRQVEIRKESDRLYWYGALT